MEHINNKCILRHEENMKILMLHRHARMVQAIVRQAAQLQKCSVSHTPHNAVGRFSGDAEQNILIPAYSEKAPEPRLSGNQEERGTTARTSATPSRTQKRMSYPANGMPYTLSGSV